MRLLDRYLLRELLIPFGYCLGGFLILWISFDLMSLLDFFQKKLLQPADVAEYYLVKMPEVLVQIMPIALLLALLYALSNHARHNELTAIRAAGVTLWRLCLPHLAVGLLLTAGLYLLNELAVPDAAEATRQIADRYQKDQPNAADKLWQKNLAFINHHAGRTWQIEAYHLRTHEMIKPQIDWAMPGGSRLQIHAEGATRVEGVWVFTNVQEILYLPTQDALGSPFKTNLTRYPELTESPQLIASEIKIRKVLGSFKDVNRAQLSVAEILHYLDLHPQMEAAKLDWLLTKLHSRLALPWTCLVVVLIAIPFGTPAGRRNVFVGVAASVFLCFTFLLIREISVALGMNGNVPAWLAGWAPGLLFAVAGIVMTNRVR